jgi:glucosamine--fructose-6-phosphate aminotransferase (isomerizing)
MAERPELLDGLQALPESLRTATEADWSPALDVLAPAKNIMVVGRGIASRWRWNRR